MQQVNSGLLVLVVWGGLFFATVGSASAWENGPAVMPAGDASSLASAAVIPASPNAPEPMTASADTAAPATLSSFAAAASTSADPQSQQYFTLDELKVEMRKLAWTKGEYSIVPYGTLWGTMSYESQATNPGNYSLYVYPPSQEPGSALHVDARSTRLGLDILGPRVACLNGAQSGGRVEIDFQRLIDTENKAGVLLRHAYVEVKDEDFRLLAGQTWDVISPLNPGMLMYSVGWDAGNIGYRRAQLRGERYLALDDCTLLTVQSSLNADLMSESTTGLTTCQPGWPVIEGRVALALGPRGAGCHPIEIGASGHIGDQEFSLTTPWNPTVINLMRRTWSFNVDLTVPITDHFGTQAELFTGENLGTFLGGVGQGVDIGTATKPGSLNGIRSSGGWVDVWYDWTCRLHSHVGYGIDDPVDQDVSAGRTYNQMIFTNASYDLAQHFLVGLEVSEWKTLWNVPVSTAESSRVEFVVKYGF